MSLNSPSSGRSATLINRKKLDTTGNPQIVGHYGHAHLPGLFGEHLLRGKPRRKLIPLNGTNYNALFATYLLIPGGFRQ